MNLIKISCISLATLIVGACSVSKKTSNSKSTTKSSTATTFTTTPKSTSGIYAPGNEELTAIHAKYKDVTMQTLSDGYAIYTGVCTNCHTPKNIYTRKEEEWPGIIENMAMKAKITDVQKDAVYKYVMAIKATQHN